MHLLLKLRSQPRITIRPMDCTGPAFFEYFVLPDDRLVEEAETRGIKPRENNSIRYLVTDSVLITVTS
jgi:hypothetical protein